MSMEEVNLCLLSVMLDLQLCLDLWQLARFGTLPWVMAVCNKARQCLNKVLTYNKLS